MSDEKNIGSVLYTKATSELEKQVEEELKVADPPQESISKILQELEETNEDT